MNINWGHLCIYKGYSLDTGIITRKNKAIKESGALSGKILLVRIVKNNKIDVYFRAG